ncbi:hypothetical protein BV006_01826 [Haemophilus influenzae]|nr:hypothetical protein BV094_01377 [Haemophilus influenzae]PRJ58938.1 hypothetical protein BV097_01128 [Haemophilus influenzae]PRJ94934.1 hypothetical protein BV166_01206 [Haemophilus influenzae]PRK61392.1 hypothetical protein BV167_01237 [Haemophilus influenzae]PRM06501.1 hypothetical protein BV006_01826 [Haemophilus influenzae]
MLFWNRNDYQNDRFIIFKISFTADKTMTNFVIETQHLCECFGQVTVLDDINIQIKLGEFVALMEFQAKLH